MTPFSLFRRAALVLAAAVLVAAPFAGCGGTDEPAGTPAEAEARPLVLSAADVARAEVGALASGVVLTGSLEPYRVVNVRAQVPGTVSGLRHDEGDRVGQGTRLATIQAEGLRSQAASAQAAVAAAQAGLALARRQHESARTLHEAGAMSQIEFQSTEAQLEAAQAQLEAAQAAATGAGEQARHTLVTAPLAGAVSARFVEEGEAVSPGQNLFTLVNTSVLELAGQVPVTQAAGVRVGQAVEFAVDGFPGRTFRGEVARVVPTADPQTRQVGVFLRLPNPGDLVGGLFATGRVVGEERQDALLVPAAAVRSGEGTSSYVLTVEGGVVRRAEVTVEAEDPVRGLVAVGGGLEAGALVVVSPSSTLTEGARVELNM